MPRAMTISAMSDSLNRSGDLAEPASSDARRRFELLCLPFEADLLRFAFWLCRDRALAEDVIQETLLRAWKSIDSLQDPRATRSWLLTIARRELARVFERKRLPTIDINSALESGDGALVVHPSHELEEMRRAILRLDAVYREPLVMQVLLGLTTQEIAAQLDISVPAVLTRLFRARHLLRRRLDGTDESWEQHE